MLIKKFPHPGLKQTAMCIAHCSGYGTINTGQSSFSMSKIVKSKFGNRLTDENIVNELRCASTKLPVDINSRRTKVFRTISKIITHQTRNVSLW